jgi:N-acylneuraminate cytidylyltransferase
MRVAVIPARGGSKRIPKKNIREFAGKPMIAHPIQWARRSQLFDRVIVSTEDHEIAEVARHFGAEVPFVRPRELADDYTGTTPVVAHAIRWLQDQAETPAAVCCIYATAPFLRPEDLQQGLTTLQEARWSYVFSATTSDFSIFRAFEKCSNGGLQMLFPQHFETRSQDLPEVLRDAGQFYWGTTQAWLENRRIFDIGSTVVMIPRWRVQDIDTPADWERAEIMWKAMQAMPSI